MLHENYWLQGFYNINTLSLIKDENLAWNDHCIVCGKQANFLIQGKCIKDKCYLNWGAPEGHDHSAIDIICSQECLEYLKLSIC